MISGGITYSNITESTEKSPLSRVQQSIEDEVDVDFINFYGNFVLMDARGVDCLDMIKYLVEQGAKINLKNKKGKTALDITLELEHTEVVKILRDSGATE